MGQNFRGAYPESIVPQLEHKNAAIWAVPGYRYTEFEGFCIPPEEAQARFDEALNRLARFWEG